MATLNTLLVNADSVNGDRQWSLQDFATIDEGIAAADGSAIGDDTNANAALLTSFLLSDVNTDLGNMDTLSWQVRYRVTGAQTNTRSLGIRILTEDGATLLAGQDDLGDFATVASAISNTTFQNSSVTQFAYVNTAATKAQWNNARVILRLTISKSMAGDTNGVRVDTLQITGTYTAASNILTADSGSFSLSGQSATLRVGRKVSADAASFTHSGQSASLEASREITAESASFALSGQDASFQTTRRLAADAGSFAHTGQDASLEAGRKVAADSGTYSLSGQDASLEAARRLVADAGSFTHTGQDAGLNYSAGSAVLDAQPGSFVLSGSAASLLHGRKVSADPGSYNLAGQDINLRTARKLNPEIVAFSLSGQVALLKAGRLVSADLGTISATGVDASLLKDSILAAQQGSYVLSGISAGLLYSGGAAPFKGRSKLRITMANMI